MPPSSCAQNRSCSDGGICICSHTSQPMWFTGTLLNLLTVLAGGLLGTVLGDRLPPRLRENRVARLALFSGLLSDAQLREMSAVGGLLIVGVGLKLLKLRDVQVADYLPAIAVAPILVAVVTSVGGGVPK